MADNEMRVTFPGGVKVDALYRGITIHTDQPVRDGGEGSAPWPFSLFLASLATCAGYYVLVFCKNRNIPLDGVEIVQRMEKNPETKLIGCVTIDIIVPSSFPEKYLAALVRAADQCTVKAHLQNPPRVETRAVVRQA